MMSLKKIKSEKMHNIKMQYKHTVKIFLKAHKIFRIVITSERRRKEHTRKFKTYVYL